VNGISIVLGTIICSKTREKERQKHLQTKEEAMWSEVMCLFEPKTICSEPASLLLILRHAKVQQELSSEEIQTINRENKWRPVLCHTQVIEHHPLSSVAMVLPS
jgi:hypothetical protein